MQAFLARHQQQIAAVLSGFDRMIFRGSLRSLSYADGLGKFFWSQGIGYQGFAAFVQRLSIKIKTHAQAYAAAHHRPYRYLESADVSKEEIARRILKQDGVEQGLVCVLACVEPCQTFALRRDPETRRPEVCSVPRKCLFFYDYFVDREFGLMHVRLQSWVPMSIQVWVNGREYLARRMDRAGIRYRKEDNCFTWIEDPGRAQQFLDELVRSKRWPAFLNVLARRVNPWLDRRNKLGLRRYYWTLRDAEHATDLLFRSPEALARLYPALLAHATTHFHCDNVLRFLGRRINARFAGEVVSNVKRRVEGTRIKHWVEENSIKMYDKAGSVLRIETTINNPQRFRTRRRVIRQGRPTVTWAPLRKGVFDIPRRVEISQAANERYLEALSIVGEPTPAKEILDPVARRVMRGGRHYRGLHALEPAEAELFALLLEGAFKLQGFRNGDLRRRLFPDAERDSLLKRQASGKATRLLRLLRAHGLIAKVPHTFYYRVTTKGQRIMTAALKLRSLNVLTYAA